MNYQVKILGLDPGSSIAGFACIGSKKSMPLLPKDFSILGAGAIRFDRKVEHSLRISQLHSEVHRLIEEFRPDICVLEKAFCGVNPSSALKLGEARGALIAAVHTHQIELIQLTPRYAKKCITGNGNAEKSHVAHALKSIIGFELGTLPYDVADALALALTHGLQINTNLKLGISQGSSCERSN